MTLPNWNQIALVRVEAKPAGLWTMAVEYVPPSRLLRFRVVDKDASKNPVATEWKLSEDASCGPNGLPSSSNTPKTSLLCSATPLGALIAKIGGSTADVPDSSVS